jgi:hypothetical protein
MKSFSIKKALFLAGVLVLSLYAPTNAEWRRVGDFPREEFEEGQREGSIRKEVPQTSKAERKKPLWKFISENEWGRHFYDAENITYGEKITRGRVRRPPSFPTPPAFCRQRP